MTISKTNPFFFPLFSKIDSQKKAAELHREHAKTLRSTGDVQGAFEAQYPELLAKVADQEVDRLSREVERYDDYLGHRFPKKAVPESLESNSAGKIGSVKKTEADLHRPNRVMFDSINFLQSDLQIESPKLFDIE